MTKLNVAYVLPNSTQLANLNLAKIYKEASKLSNNSCLSNTLLADHLNITYGYLGLFAKDLLCNNLSTCLQYSHHSYILDHAYAPASLKGRIFRLSKMSKDLKSIVFPFKLISDIHLSSIKSYLCQLQAQETINIAVASSRDLKNIGDREQVSLLIKASPVLNRLKRSCHDDQSLSKWLKFNLKDCDGKIHLVSVKCNEVSLTPHGLIKSNRYEVNKVDLRFSQFKHIYSATSMLAIPFILHSIPTYLSSKHPLFDCFGSYIPPLDKSTAFKLVLRGIKSTSVSLENFHVLENYLLDLSKFALSSQ